jgi:hypothetical protein
MRTPEPQRLAVSAKKRVNRMSAKDRRRDRVTSDLLRDLHVKRRVEAVKLQDARNRILGRPAGWSLKTILDPGYAPHAEERGEILRKGHAATELPNLACAPVTTEEHCHGCGTAYPLTGECEDGIKKRYEFLDALRPISRERTRTCRRKRISTTVQLSERNGHVTMTGVETCANVHGCPVCAAKIYQMRANQIDSMVERWIGWGPERIGPAQAWAGMLTLTIAHGYSDKLELTACGIANAWRYFRQGREGQRIAQLMGLKHFARALEVTHGANGWHAHLHVLELLNGEPSEDLYKRDPETGAVSGLIIDHWQASVERALGSAYVPSNEHGVDLKQITQARDGRYIAKMGLEVAGGWETKGAAKGNRTFWQVAKDATQGDRRSVALWQEAQTALFGTRQLTWSRRTKGTFGLEDLEDEAVVLEEEHGVVADSSESERRPRLDLEVSGDRWDEGCRRDRRFVSRVIGAASFAMRTGDWSGLLTLVGKSSVVFVAGGRRDECRSSRSTDGLALRDCSQISREPTDSRNAARCL